LVHRSNVPSPCVLRRITCCRSFCTRRSADRAPGTRRRTRKLRRLLAAASAACGTAARPRRPAQQGPGPGGGGRRLRRGLLAADLVGAPGALDLAADALQRLDLLVRRHAAVVQLVHVVPDARILLQQRLPQRLRAPPPRRPLSVRAAPAAAAQRLPCAPIAPYRRRVRDRAPLRGLGGGGLRPETGGSLERGARPRRKGDGPCTASATGALRMAPQRLMSTRAGGARADRARAPAPPVPAGAGGGASSGSIPPPILCYARKEAHISSPQTAHARRSAFPHGRRAGARAPRLRRVRRDDLTAGAPARARAAPASGAP